ncbi:unnamed protein product [Amaranthus hypochondriacus]
MVEPAKARGQGRPRKAESQKAIQPATQAGEAVQPSIVVANKSRNTKGFNGENVLPTVNWTTTVNGSNTHSSINLPLNVPTPFIHPPGQETPISESKTIGCHLQPNEAVEEDDNGVVVVECTLRHLATEEQHIK